MRVRPIAIALALLIWSSPLSSVSRSEVTPLLFTSAAEYKPLAWMNGSNRFPAGATIFIHDSEGRRPLVSHFAATADPAISPDATRLLFAGKKAAADAWQIWELALIGGAPRQVSSCTADCIRPLYLPGDRMAFAEKVKGRFLVAVAQLSNGAAVPVTYAPGNYFPTDILRDGRILFEAAQPFGLTATSEIYTVYSDGSGVEAYRCDHGSNRHSARQVSSGDVVFAGKHGLARFSSALAHQIPIALPAADYAGDVVETADGDWLLTARPRPDGTFAIFRWKPGTDHLRPLVTERDANAVQPALISQRPIPNRHPSALHDWSYANLLCLNAYSSKFTFKTGTIAAVRLYAQSGTGGEKLLGESGVEKDGSFYVRTPADQPLKIELVNADGKTLKKEAGWFWLRRGEQRVCVGCHAGPETAPENAVPAVLLRSTIAVDMTGNSHVAAGGH